MSLLSALQTALGSLLAHQAALSVAVENIANVTDPDYVRRTARPQALPPLPDPSLPEPQGVGGGVALAIIRHYDSFLAAAIKTNESRLNRYGTLLTHLERVESFFNEAQGFGLSQAFAEFFEAWRDLAMKPEEMARRVIVLERAQALLDRFYALIDQLSAERENNKVALEREGRRVNELLERIARLNERIAAAHASGKPVYDLLDAQEATLQELAKAVPIQVKGHPSGMVSVTIEGHEVVTRRFWRPIQLTPSGFVLSDTKTPLPIKTGILSALWSLGKRFLSGLQSALTSLMDAFIAAVNQLHEVGFGLDGNDGRPFFVSTGGKWRINPDLYDRPNLLAASETGDEGDGRIAFAIAQLEEKPLPQLDGKNLSDAYRFLLADLSAQIRHVRDLRDTFQIIHQALQDERDSLSGVSLDEEMVDILRFRKAYLAAMKVLQAVDELLAELLARL